MPECVGKYELKRLLGKGASGSVYLAADTFAGGEVALKLIDESVFDDPEIGEGLRTLFLNEASLAGKLSHPHIVAILDAAVMDGASYIAMEYVPGGNLSPYARQENLLSISDVIQIGFKCSGALDYAFRQGIVHRDIKPANIMCVAGTSVKIGDFGAAHLHRGLATTLNIGTPAYMSPEQLESRPLTHHSDMYALGVVLYELLAGRRPFVGRSIPELVNRILQEETEPPSRWRADIPADLDRAVMKALSKRPEDRFESWAELALELARIGNLAGRQQGVPDSVKFEALKRVEMLAELSEPEIWELASAARWARHEAGRVILREGELGNSLLLLASGQVKVTKLGRLVNLAGAGECLGEAGFLRRGAAPRLATVEALTDLLVAEFTSDTVEKLSAMCQLRLTRAIVADLIERLSVADARVARATA